jgi:hypothetical protein
LLAPFDPAGAAVLVAPPDDGPGHWAGAPGAFADTDAVYLVYRRRWPRPRRGGELLIARGDGESFTTIWRARREDFSSPSIERCAMMREGRVWRLYVSYVDGVDGRWHIDVIEATSPEDFDPGARRPALDPDTAHALAVKDPWLRRVDGGWWMFVSYGERADTTRSVHASGDALSTGIVKSETGLATSPDGIRWRWQGKVLGASASGWDRFTARLTTAISDGQGGWLGLYDGSATVEENYEERCGLARSADLRTWERVGSGPAVGAAGGPGTVRYVESVRVGDGVLFYFERTRRDGAHELCVARAERVRSSASPRGAGSRRGGKHPPQPAASRQARGSAR